MKPNAGFDQGAYARLRRKELLLACALGGLTSAACAAGIQSALVLALSGGGGGGGTVTTGEGVADFPTAVPFSDRFVGALVIPNSVSVTDFELRQNGALVGTDTNVPPNQRQPIEQILQQQGIFDPVNEYLHFYRTTDPLIVQDDDQIAVRFVQSEGTQPVAQSRIGFGGSNETDILDGPPLTNLQAHDPRSARPYPSSPGPPGCWSCWQRW